MPNNNTEEDERGLDSTSSELNIGPGSTIRNARESQGLSVDDLAAEIKITRQKLLKIEHDQFETVGTDTFVRGYLRNSARVLKLDAGMLIDQYNVYMASNNRSAVDVIPKPPTTASGKPKWLLPVILSITLLLAWAGASLLFNSNSVAEPESDKTSEPVTGGEKSLGKEIFPSENSNHDDASVTVTQTVSLNGSRSLPEKKIGAASNLSTLAEVSQPIQKAEAPLTATLTATTEASEEVKKQSQTLKVSTAYVGSGQLDFDFKDDCWLEVRDSAGRRLFSNSKAAGESLSLQGEAPFSVRLGNVHAVEIKFNGVNVELTPNEFRKTLKVNIPNNL